MSDNIEFKSRINIKNVEKTVQKIISELKKVIVGQDAMIELLISAVLADGHVIIEGVPGIAKTLTAKLLAKTFSVGFSRIQFTPDLMPSDILGTSIFNMKKGDFEFKSGPIFSNIILIDEINRSPAKTQAALFEVMEEQQVTIDGKTYIMENPFLVFATQNPIEYEGTYRLPEAQLDRFLFKVKIDYPSLEDEIQILNESHNRKDKDKLEIIKPVLSQKNIKDLQTIVKKIHVEENLLAYIGEIVHKTRNHHAIFLGGSPRASLSILNGSKALAVMDGRDFVNPEDIKRTVFPALTHRVILTPEKEMEGVIPEDIIDEILESIEVPR